MPPYLKTAMGKVDFTILSMHMLSITLKKLNQVKVHGLQDVKLHLFFVIFYF